MPTLEALAKADDKATQQYCGALALHTALLIHLSPCGRKAAQRHIDRLRAVADQASQAFSKALAAEAARPLPAYGVSYIAGAAA